MERVGYIKLHRKIFDSKIFLEKPSDWLKIWLFILGNVNFCDNGAKEGSKFLRYDWIAIECRVTYNQVFKCMTWLKKEGMVNIERQPNGGIIEVANWSEYQGEKDTPKANQKLIKDESKANAYNKKERNKEIKNNIISTNVDNNSEETSLAVVEEFGNKEINAMLDLLKKAVGLSDFKDSHTWQRRYTKNIMELTKKIGKEEFLFRLKSILQDEFKAKNCNKLAYLYGELKSYIHSPVVEKKNKKVSDIIF